MARRHYTEIPLWRDVEPEKWNDWHWQVANRITTVEALKQVLDLGEEAEAGVRKCLEVFRMAITPYYASLIDPDDPNCPIRKQAVPTAAEVHVSKADLLDPLHEDVDSPVPGITHRYPDRVLFLVTDQCSMYCRHCTRRRFTGQTDRPASRQQLEMGLEYIRNNPSVRDVLLSGGDALLISDDRLEYLLRELRRIPHVEIIRLDQGPGGPAAEDHARAVCDAQEVPPRLAQHPLQPSGGGDRGIAAGHGPAGRRRGPAGEPDGAPEGG